MDFPSTTDEAARRSLHAGIRRLLQEYAGKEEDKLVEHLINIRNRCSFTKSPFFSNYCFTNISIAHHYQYSDVLRRIKEDRHLLLDLGCGLGQNLRQLIFDGASMQDLQGFDNDSALMELGTDLFVDGDRYRMVTIQGDILATRLPPGLSEGKFDIIFASFFFDRFLKPENQLTAVQRALGMLKARSGSVLFGWQIGSPHGTTDLVVDVDGEQVFAYSESGFRHKVFNASIGVQQLRPYRVDIEMQPSIDFRLGNQMSMMHFTITLI